MRPRTTTRPVALRPRVALVDETVVAILASRPIVKSRASASHKVVRHACTPQWHPMSHLRSQPRSLLAPTAHSRRQGQAAIVAVLLWALAGAAAADDAAGARAQAAAPDSQATVTTVVAGIVSYTRWPGEARSIRLCTIGRGPGVDELLAAADLGSAQQSVPVQAARGAAPALNDCDAIYVGILATSTARNLLQSAVGRPVLMIGEGQEFCTDGGMFCLQPAASAVGFAVNLDAVARSGLRVNPRVLRMARSATGSGQ